MQAITTKFVNPTDTKGSRIKATAEAGSVTVAWDYDLNTEGNHTAAAKALCAKLGWVPAADNRYTETVAGYLKAGHYVHVFPPYSSQKTQ